MTSLRAAVLSFYGKDRICSVQSNHAARYKRREWRVVRSDSLVQKKTYYDVVEVRKKGDTTGTMLLVYHLESSCE